MKKILFVLGVFAALSFTACNTKSDCTCTMAYSGNSQSIDITDFDGDCKDINWDNIPGWENGASLGFTFECKDK
ncbi:MAG: hypothetical protein LBM25_00430 [Bacteroidales bacterium]|jgi:hypothetical protein|nr:hypothetical protein [Bacteroidales bacterium]